MITLLIAGEPEFLAAVKLFILGELEGEGLAVCVAVVTGIDGVDAALFQFSY